MIVVHEEKPLFEIRTERTVYLFGVNGKGAVQHLYWGEPIKAAELVPLLQGRAHSSFDIEIDLGMNSIGSVFSLHTDSIGDSVGIQAKDDLEAINTAYELACKLNELSS